VGGQATNRTRIGAVELLSPNGREGKEKRKERLTESGA